MEQAIAEHHEELLISNFVKKDRRDRLRALLKNEKGRHKLRSRLAHSFDFDSQWIHELPANEQFTDGILRVLLSKKAPDRCYVISELSSLDRKALLLKDALAAVVGSGIASILSCIPGQLVYVEGEEPGKRYILERPARQT